MSCHASPPGGTLAPANQWQSRDSTANHAAATDMITWVQSSYTWPWRCGRHSGVIIHSWKSLGFFFWILLAAHFGEWSPKTGSIVFQLRNFLWIFSLDDTSSGYHFFLKVRIIFNGLFCSRVYYDAFCLDGPHIFIRSASFGRTTSIRPPFCFFFVLFFFFVFFFLVKNYKNKNKIQVVKRLKSWRGLPELKPASHT